MAIYTLFFPHEINVSIQEGDILYKSTPSNMQMGRNHPGSFSQYGDSKPKKVGRVILAGHDNFGNFNFVQYDDAGFNPANKPDPYTDYIYFSKDNRANISGIVGYFAKTKFVNNSTFPAEIFATAVDYVESSK